MVAATLPSRRPALLRLAPAGRRARGFTLIELMIVVVVVAVLAAIAVPSYQNSLRKSRRTEARTALTVCAQRLERHYTEKNAYTDATVASLCSTEETASYALELTVTDANRYTLAAAPRGAQTGDACGRFTLTQDGVRGVADASLTTADCW